MISIDIERYINIINIHNIYIYTLFDYYNLFIIKNIYLYLLTNNIHFTVIYKFICF